MTMLIKFIVCFIAGIGAGLGTGFAGMSAAAVISPMLITFLDMPAYEAVGIALASDVLASAVSAYTYGKNKNLDIRNGVVMMVSVLCFTMVGSWIASQVPNSTMGSFSVFMTFLLGVKFIVKPVMTTKNAMEAVDPKKRFVQSVICGVMIGFICGFIGAGGGMMMLLILTSVLGYELKTGYQRIHYDLYSLYRCRQPLCHRRYAEPVVPGVLCGVHAVVGAHCRTLRQQGQPRHPEPRHRRCAGCAGGGDYGGKLH